MIIDRPSSKPKRKVVDQTVLDDRPSTIVGEKMAAQSLVGSRGLIGKVVVSMP